MSKHEQDRLKRFLPILRRALPGFAVFAVVFALSWMPGFGPIYNHGDNGATWISGLFLLLTANWTLISGCWLGSYGRRKVAEEIVEGRRIELTEIDPALTNKSPITISLALAVWLLLVALQWVLSGVINPTPLILLLGVYAIPLLSGTTLSETLEYDVAGIYSLAAWIASAWWLITNT